MSTPLKLKCEFALIDVKTGRGKLLAALKKGQKFSVALRGTINPDWNGNDDGVSQEFAVDVASFTMIPTKGR